MGADGGSAQTRYIFDALESIRLARFSEEQFEYEAASKLYDTAVHLFITGVQKDGNKERQDLVRKKLAKCLAKAEKCRAIVRKQQNNSGEVQSTTIDEEDEDEDDDLLVGVDGKRVEDYLSQKDSLGRHFNQDHTEWPHNLNMYQLKQVITSDIWLVARIVDKHDKNLAIMVGVPRINKSTQKPITNATQSPALANQETIEAIDTSQMPHYELGKALSLRIAAIMYRPNRYHITTGQKFLQEFITDICLEIRTQYTIFCIVKATKETLEYARSVRGLVTNMRHSECKDQSSMCQACQLRQTQRNIIRFSSSSSGSSSLSSGEEQSEGKSKVSRSNSQKKVNKRAKVTRKLSQEEVRKSLAAKLESESGLSSSNTNSRNVAKNSTSNPDATTTSEPNTTPATTPTTTNNKKCSPSSTTSSASALPSTTSSTARRVSTPIIVLNSSKIREKTRAYEKKRSAGSSDGETVSSNPNSSTPTTSGICTTASSSNSTSRCASSDSNASTQKPDYAETRTVREHKITKNSSPKCDEVIDLVGQMVINQ